MWITEIVIDFPPRFHFRMWKEGEADRGGGECTYSGADAAAAVEMFVNESSSSSSVSSSSSSSPASWPSPGGKLLCAPGTDLHKLVPAQVTF